MRSVRNPRRWLLSSISSPVPDMRLQTSVSGRRKKLPPAVSVHNAGQCAHTSKFRPWRIKTRHGVHRPRTRARLRTLPQESVWAGIREKAIVGAAVFDRHVRGLFPVISGYHIDGNPHRDLTHNRNISRRASKSRWPHRLTILGSFADLLRIVSRQ